MDAAIDKSKPRPAMGAAAPSSQGNLAVRGLKFAFALALVPLCIGLTMGAQEYYLSVTRGTPIYLKWFGGGALAFAVLAVLLWRPVTLYVFGHELMHALATWMCLGTVTNLKASATGGQVTSSKPNTFIRLAPYCVPVYALGLAGVYIVLNAYWRPLAPYFYAVSFALGFLYAFHLGFTLWSMRRDQPDFQQDGWFFSLVLIYIANLAFAMLMLGFLFRGEVRQSWPALRDSSIAGWRRSTAIYSDITSTAQKTIQRHSPSRAEIESDAPKE